MLKIFVNLILCLYTGKKIRDIEMEEKMEELQDKIRELEKHNLQYKEKVIFSDGFGLMMDKPLVLIIKYCTGSRSDTTAGLILAQNDDGPLKGADGSYPIQIHANFQILMGHLNFLRALCKI